MRLVVGNRAGLHGVRIGGGWGDRPLDTVGREPRGVIEEGMTKYARSDKIALHASRRPGWWWDPGRPRQGQPAPGAHGAAG